MLFLRPLLMIDIPKRRYVKCPACGRGRLCDRPESEQVKVLEILDDVAPTSGVILKCPKCSVQVLVSFGE